MYKRQVLHNDLKKLTLLYVESDEETTQNNQLFFQNFFDTILLAKDEQEALAQFENNKIDMLITEIELQNSNGLNLIEQVKKTHKELSLIHI